MSSLATTTEKTVDISRALKEAVWSLQDKGYMRLNLIEIGILKESEVAEMREICMSEYYKFFADRGIDPATIQIDLNSSYRCAVACP